MVTSLERLMDLHDRKVETISAILSGLADCRLNGLSTPMNKLNSHDSRSWYTFVTAGNYVDVRLISTPKASKVRVWVHGCDYGDATFELASPSLIDDVADHINSRIFVDL